MLTVKNLYVCNRKHAGILNGVSLQLDIGDCIGLTGASGSGKTTLIKAVMRLQNGDLIISDGKILLEETDLVEKPFRYKRRLCGKVLGFIPQNPITAFFPHVRIGKQIIETIRIYTDLSKSDATALATSTLLKVNLHDTARVMKAYPGELSGGMLQRIAMTLIFCVKPQYVLADEPTSALDNVNRDQLLELLCEYKKGAGVLFISHDVEAMKILCPTTCVMENGRIIEEQRTKELFSCPQQAWTKAFALAAAQRKEVLWRWSSLN